MLVLVPTAGEARRLFDGPVPTSERVVTTAVGGCSVEAALCGFGPAAAGALAALALTEARPRRCVLAGMAGTYRPEALPVGGVFEAGEVRTADVGRGRGEGFVGPDVLGTAQAPARGDTGAIVDRIELDGGPAPAREEVVRGVLLTVSAASATPSEADALRRRHPDALAEDMEGFAVALACRRTGTPLTILRGISNVVGDARERWDRAAALTALREALDAYLVAGGGGALP